MAGLGGEVNIRLEIDGGAPSFHQFHSSDTLAEVASSISRLCGEKKWPGELSLEDSGINPARKLSLSSDACKTLFALGMFPGGSIRVTSVTLASISSVEGGRGEIAGAHKRPAPSALLSSHIGRFESDPLMSAAPKFNVRGSSSIPEAPTGQADERTAETLERAARLAAKDEKKRNGAEQMRRMVMKQRAVGTRDNLAQEERFFLEVVAICGTPHYLFFPLNWPLGKALDDAQVRQRSNKIELLLVVYIE